MCPGCSSSNPRAELGVLVDQMIVDTIVAFLSGYAGVGTLFALYFLAWGARHMDPGHEHSGVAARLILVPGVIALWPILALRILSGARFKG